MGMTTNEDIIEAVRKYRDAFDSEDMSFTAVQAELEARDKLLDAIREYDSERLDP